MNNTLDTLNCVTLALLSVALLYANTTMLDYCRELRKTLHECRDALKRLEGKH